MQYRPLLCSTLNQHIRKRILNNFFEDKLDFCFILYRLYHETFQTHLVLQPEVTSENNGEAVFRFRGFRGDYTLAVIDTESGTVTTLPDLYSIK